MTVEELAALEEVAQRFRGTLNRHFASEAGRGKFELAEGQDTPLIGRVRDHAEAMLVDVSIVEQPALGLIVSLAHWSIPPGAVLDVFVAAYGDHGVLTDAFVIAMLPMIHFHERLECRSFASAWVTRPNGHLYVELYDETFPERRSKDGA